VPARDRVDLAGADHPIHLRRDENGMSTAVDDVQAQLPPEHPTGRVDLLDGESGARLTRRPIHARRPATRHDEGDVEPIRVSCVGREVHRRVTFFTLRVVIV